MSQNDHWYAVRTMRPFELERVLEPLLPGVYFPKETVYTSHGKAATVKPVIANIMFLKGCEERILELEKDGRTLTTGIPQFWVYRNVAGTQLQPITESEMNLLFMLTGPEETRCEIYNKDNFLAGQEVEVIAGPFAGYRGHTRRVRKDRHVLVQIEGVCVLMLPYIHPDLLSKIE